MTHCKLAAMVLTGATLLAAFVTPGAGQEYKKGDRVIALRDGPLMLSEETVGTVRKGNELIVEHIQDEWLWVRVGQTAGWLDRQYVLLAEPDRRQSAKQGQRTADLEKDWEEFLKGYTERRSKLLRELIALKREGRSDEAERRQAELDRLREERSQRHREYLESRREIMKTDMPRQGQSLVTIGRDITIGSDHVIAYGIKVTLAKKYMAPIRSPDGSLLSPRAGEEVSFGADEWRLTTGDLKLRLTKTRELSVNDRSYGTLKEGDSVVVQDPFKVIVNRQARSPR